MRLLLFLSVLGAGYYYFLTQATGLVLQQTAQLQQTYSYVANNADQIAAGGAR